MIDNDSRFCQKCGDQLAVTRAVCSVSAAQPGLADKRFETTTAGTPGAFQSQPKASGYSLENEDLTATVIDDKYRLEYLIGRGGMGAVYCATRLLIGDMVAIKILRRDQVSDAEAVERFRREAQAAARLKHPNAVTIYDFGVSSDGLIFLVMEKVEGESLRALIERQGPLTPSAVAEIISQACAALDEAHRQNIVHRDLKPDNILVQFITNGLRIKVLDFGIAKIRDVSAAAGNLTQAGAVMGTPHYMSPEQCLGEELDGRSDIYSLGVVLHEMLSGQVPFNSPASTAVVIQHVTQPPPALRAINVSISPAIEAVVLRALQKRREDRPQTANDLAQEFTGAVNNGPLPNVGPYNSGARQPLSQSYPPVANTPASNVTPTMMFQTPNWVSRSAPQVPPIPPATAKASRKTLLFAVAFLAVVIAAGLWLWLGHKSSIGPAQRAKDPSEVPVAPSGMIYVRGGEFLMGSDDGPLSERPRHNVSTDAFFIDSNEVTCEEYRRFMLATGHPAPDSWVNSQYPPEAARQPVTGVTWDDANDYARWTGKRLPTEEEWEKAARGEDGRRYPWGNEWKEGLANVSSSGIGHPSDIGIHSSGKSPYGAWDMVGNVWEWTASQYEPYPGGQITDQKPGDLRVIRGGCYKSSKDQATTTLRIGWPARPLSKETNYEQTGLRCAKDAPTNEASASANESK
jgi:serine/threonine-protein kinase